MGAALFLSSLISIYLLSYSFWSPTTAYPLLEFIGPNGLKFRSQIYFPDNVPANKLPTYSTHFTDKSSTLDRQNSEDNNNDLSQIIFDIQDESEKKLVPFLWLCRWLAENIMQNSYKISNPETLAAVTLELRSLQNIAQHFIDQYGNNGNAV